ncbi:MAG: DUF998 domain-containing protein [Gemmatimonadota bacterium]|nr:DUF998 domain-containing protein [Gemmatimonadota bacterium]
MSGHPREQPLVSYLTLRRVVGLLGIGLPVVLAVLGFALCGCDEIRPSISDYYGLRTRDVFVGVLFTIAWFLFTYRGYDARDDLAGNLACILALAVALFPSTAAGWERTVHFVSAAGFFLVLACFSLFLFTRSGADPTPMKLVRNRLYRTCGWIIVGAIALAGAYALLPDDTPLARWKPVFWLETLALWAFGASWAVKGETLLTDR